MLDGHLAFFLLTYLVLKNVSPAYLGQLGTQHLSVGNYARRWPTDVRFPDFSPIATSSESLAPVS